MEEILLFATIIAPVAAALTEVVKRTVNVSKNLLPITAIVVGLLIGLASGTFSELNWDVRLWAGALAGLSGVGLFELITRSDGKTKE